MLRKLLEAKRIADGMNDSAFATYLGIDRRYWGRVRDGSQRPGVKFLHGVMNRYPELTPECLIFLRSGGSENPDSGPVYPVAPATTERKTPRPPTVSVVGSA